MNFLSDFGLNPLLLAAQVVNFLLLLFILKKFLYQPILKVLETRKKKIEESLQQAEEIEKKLQETEEQSEKIIARTLQQAQKILDETKEVAAQMLADTNKQAEQILLRAQESGRKILQREKEVLMDQLKENAGRLIFLAFEKITGKQVTKEDQKRLIEKEVRNLS